MPLGPKIFWRSNTLDAFNSQLFLLLKDFILIIAQEVKGFFRDLWFGLSPAGACDHLSNLFLLIIIVTN